MHGLANSADCWFVMSIYSLPTAPSSTSPASGSHSGDVFETRSRDFYLNSYLPDFSAASDLQGTFKLSEAIFN